MLNPFIEIISWIIDLMNLALFIWIIIGLLVHFQIVNAFHPLISKAQFYLGRVFNPLLDPIRKRMPDLGGLDLSPLILLLAMKFIQSAMYHWLWNV